MRKDAMTTDEINRLINGSRRLRLRPGDSRWLIAEGVDYASLSGTTLEKDRLQSYLEECVREKYGNPIVIWILLNVIVPVVVKLIIEWWKNRNNTQLKRPGGGSNILTPPGWEKLLWL